MQGQRYAGNYITYCARAVQKDYRQVHALQLLRAILGMYRVRLYPPCSEVLPLFA